MAEAVKRLHILPKDSVELHELLSRGGSKVWRGTYTGKLGQKFRVAAKKVPTGKDSEVRIMQQVNHKHIIKFYGVWKKTEQDMYIIMELAERGDLRHFLDQCKAKRQRLTIECIFKWTYEAASALHYLESIKHSHRNVMSLNFLIMEDYTLKLGELGLAVQLEHTQITQMSGKCKWMAPEVIQEQKRSPKSDLFSFAIVVWEIFTTDVPFVDCGNNFQVMDAVCKGKRPEIPDDCPDVLKSVMCRCWEGDRAKRPNIADICPELLPYQCQVVKHVQSLDATDDGTDEETGECSSGSSQTSSGQLTPNVEGLSLQVQHEGTTPSPTSASPSTSSPPYFRGTSLHRSIEKVISNRFLLNLAGDIGTEWEDLGVYLELEPNEIERLKMENKDNIKQAVFKMLISWRRRQDPGIGLQRVVDNLSEALSDSKRKDLEHRVRELLQPLQR